MNEKQILNADAITIKVDKCNKLLKPLGLQVGNLHYNSSQDAQRGYIPLMNGKLVTKETYDKLQRISLKKI